MKNNEWHDIPDYEGFYQITKDGRVRSLDRTVIDEKGFERKYRGIELRAGKHKRGYIKFGLSKNGITKSCMLHRLIYRTFKGEIPEGYVIDHDDNDTTNNHLDNLKRVTQRQNSSKNFKGSTSKYTGVTWHKPNKKWMAYIQINGKQKTLGYFENEEDAHKEYQNQLNLI